VINLTKVHVKVKRSHEADILIATKPCHEL